MFGDILATCPKMSSSPDALHHCAQACTRSDLVVANVILPADAENLPLTLHWKAPSSVHVMRIGKLCKQVFQSQTNNKDGRRMPAY